MRKTCSKCRATKPLKSFYKVAGGRYGRESRCADCVRKYQRAYRNKNRERIKAVIKRRSQKVRATLDGYLAHAARNKRRNAAKIGVACEITAKDLMTLYESQKGECALSGLPMYWGPGRVRRDSLSIDRIDPSRGYTLDNIQLATVRANLARGRSSEAEWTQFVEASAAKRKSAKDPAPAKALSLTEALIALSQASGGKRVTVEGPCYRIVMMPPGQSPEPSREPG